MTIAVDIGGTRLRVAGADDPETPIFSHVEQKNSQNDYSEDLKHLIAAIQKVGGGNITGIGLGTPAVLSLDRSRILHYTNLSDWNGKPLIEDLEQTFRCPVRFENDAAAAALGEAFYGAGKNQSFIHLTWGTGIGGAAVEERDGRVFLNPFEPGHQILEAAPSHTCHCGQKGCWETFCGGGEIQKRTGKLPTELSEEEWQEVIERFAQGVINLLAIRPVPLVTIGAGIPAYRPDSIPAIAALVQKRLKIVPVPEIRPSALGDRGGLLGALALFKL